MVTGTPLMFHCLISGIVHGNGDPSDVILSQELCTVTGTPLMCVISGIVHGNGDPSDVCYLRNCAR